MSPRHNRTRRGGRPGGRRSGDAEPAAVDDGRAHYGLAQVEQWPDGEWVVRTVSGGGAATKAYRCPGCDQEVPAPTPHMVAWPADGGGIAGTGPDSRRHWHTTCWRARSRRGATVQRSRNAPRHG